MTLQGFSFPLPETRLFHAGGFIYKVKIRGVKREDGFNQEMEVSALILQFPVWRHVSSCYSLEEKKKKKCNFYLAIHLGVCFPLQEIIRSVMGNLDNLQPFSSTHYNVFPCILSISVSSVTQMYASNCERSSQQSHNSAWLIVNQLQQHIRI
uniref:Uncharacterized protein n=1 Tax=Gouania willdenowi TaxID=441366 RepID=A0A8C5DXJ6_GOUWI